MNSPNNDQFNILDLPDEILLKIFKKLCAIDVFHSLLDVNQRFNRLVLDSLYVRDLDMTAMTTIHVLYDQTLPLDTQVLSRICKNILPQIHDQVHKLTVDQSTIKQILYAGNYPKLYSLSLIHFQETVLYEYLTNDLILRDLLTEKITHLNIDIKKEFGDLFYLTAVKIFALVLSLCKKLTVLNFGGIFLARKCVTPLFHLFSKNSMSSTLIKLKINIESFFDCLYLFDGRLDSLSTLIINVSNIDKTTDLQQTKQFPKLKCFSLTSHRRTCRYDTFIVELLRRMINVEELKLYLRVTRYDSTYISGIQLYDQFLIYMTQLKKFTFDIKTKVYNKNVNIELPSNEDMQRSFQGSGYQQIASYVNINSFQWHNECHIYSLPYDFEYFYNLDNSFQGGIFHQVRQLTMHDNIPFEYKLFQRISQDFPYLKYLSISNTDGMKNKQFSSTLMTFPYLTFLDLEYAHIDYAILFLFKAFVHLPCLFNLCIEYKSMKKITKNFTFDTMYFNFGNLKSLNIFRPTCPKKFHKYFPLL